MELLPAMDPSDLVTKDDLAASSIALRSEMAELRGELRSEMAELRGGLQAELQTQLREQTNRVLMFVLPTLLSGIGLAFVAARF